MIFKEFFFFGIFNIFWPSMLNLAYRQGYRYGVLYRPIPITDTDRKFSYRQNQLSADNRYIGRYRYRYSIGSYTVTDPSLILKYYLFGSLAPLIAEDNLIFFMSFSLAPSISSSKSSWPIEEKQNI